MNRLISLLTLLVVALPGPVRAAYEYQGQFGAFGTSDGQFDGPRAVAVNSFGEIVVTESGNHRYQVCTDIGVCHAEGMFGVESGQFDRPRGVTVNSTDRIFIADRGNDRIQNCNDFGSCTTFGGSGTQLGQFESPRGVAVLSDDRIVISDTDNNRIQICTDAGSCTAFGSSGAALGQFNSPAGVAVNSLGQIIVADRGNDRIQVCSQAGSCTAFGSFGTGPGQFDTPAGVAIDSQDRIIVIDRFNNRVQVCDSQGNCTTFGSFGSGNGQFNLPWGVAVDDQDRVIVADLGNHRIQIFVEASALVIDSFSASPTRIDEGQSVQLSWSASNASQCIPLGGAGNWTSQSLNPAAGSVNIQINTAGEYLFTIECSGGGDTVSRSVNVRVDAVVSIDSFTASPNPLEIGESVMLSWSVSNATQCTPLNGAGNWTSQVLNASGGSVNIQINVAGDYLFTIECTDGDNTESRSVNVEVTAASFRINAGLNDAWVSDEAEKQGFFFTVYESLQLVFISWFTFDSVIPDEGDPFTFGANDHRWVTGLGSYSGNSVTINVELTSGGIFNASDPLAGQQPNYGTITIVFNSCSEAILNYSFPDPGLSGQMTLNRVLPDNVAVCEALASE